MSIEGKTDQPKFRPAEFKRARGDEPVYPADGAVPRFWQGLTIREHLAGLAMQGLLANPEHAGTSPEDTGIIALHCADALLAELAGGKPKL